MITTVAEAVLKLCHASLNGDEFQHCSGQGCMAWRWLPLTCDPDWVAAMRKAAEELGDKTPGRDKAAAHVNANRKAYGLTEAPFRGYCGLAGKPEA